MRIGLIPAHAGKTAKRAQIQSALEAHPRSRGENAVGALSVQSSKGSSPLTRGKRPPSSQARSRAGLIPAHAGKQYPRVRRRLSMGLIPAHAGKTRTFRSARSFEQAHPRSRGENCRLCETTRRRQGSSPLTRGKRSQWKTHIAVCGLIPAHAGKTDPRRRRHNNARAHPRSRGENFACGAAIAKNVGSSPLTRGKPHRIPGQRRKRGLIPAHAGKTRIDLALRAGYRAHPRSRGENESRPQTGSPSPGSSPLTRGKLCRADQIANAGGLIPAHAGKTDSV